MTASLQPTPRQRILAALLAGRRVTLFDPLPGITLGTLLKVGDRLAIQHRAVWHDFRRKLRPAPEKVAL